MKGNAVTPDHSLMAYRLSKGDGGAITVVDSDHLVTALKLIGPEEELQLQVGNNWIARKA